MKFLFKIMDPPLNREILLRKSGKSSFKLPIGFAKAHRQSYNNITGSDNSFFIIKHRKIGSIKG